jgi:hypothetical protein
MHVYEVRPRKDHRGVDLISDGLPFGRLWYDGRNAAANAVDYAKFYSRSHDAVICVQAYEGETIPVNNHDAGVQIWELATEAQCFSAHA